MHPRLNNRSPSSSMNGQDYRVIILTTVLYDYIAHNYFPRMFLSNLFLDSQSLIVLLDNFSTGACVYSGTTLALNIIMTHHT